MEMKISGMQRMALKEAVGSNSGPDYPGIIRVDEFRGIHTVTVKRFNRAENRYDTEVVGRIGPRGEVIEATEEFPQVLAAIVEYWGE
jgi:hypothetical protein